MLNNQQMLPGPNDAFELESHPEVLNQMLQLFHQYGDAYQVFSGQRGKYTYVLSDPEMVKHVLINNHRNYEKGVGIDRVKILLGNGIMVSEGDYWKRQRRMIQPAFHRRVIESLSVDIVRANKRLLEKWVHRSETAELVSLTDDLSEITLEIVLKALFSTDFERLGHHSGEQPFALLTQEHARDLLFAMKFRALSTVIMNIMETRRRENRVEEDFLSMMMEARDQETGEGMSDKELIDETMTLIVAGHETTASALTWIWYLLCKHPEAYAKAKQEALALKGEPMGFQQLPRLNYIKQVIDEALRLYPPGWLLTRRAIKDDQIGDFYVPAGTDIFISPYIIHRHPTYWEDPEHFDPDRFDIAQHKQRPRFAYFPFSGGPRQCIGDFFAQVEMQFHLVMVLQQVDVHVIAEEPVMMEAQINLRPSQTFFAHIITNQS